MKKIITRLLFVAILLISQISMAIPAYPGLVKLSQPNGDEINAYLFGDERVSWIESDDNYTLMVNSYGYLEYANLNQKGDMVPSGITAKNSSQRSVSDINFLSTIDKKIRYSSEQIDIMLELTKAMETPRSPSKSGGVEGLTIGVRKLLVILVEYSDLSFTYTRQNFEDLFNQIGYTNNQCTGSVRDYFAASSYGKLDLQTTVVGPFTLSNTQKFYGEQTATMNDINAKQMIIDACSAADETVDFSIYDNDNNLIADGIHVIYSGKGQHNGGGADAVWAHRSKLGAQDFVSNEGIRIIDYSCASEKTSTGSMSGVGVHSHEFGHVLGLWDYYDADYQLNGISKTIGDYDIMDAGAYNNNEKTPPIYNAYSKYFLGWVNPFIIDSNMLMDITSYHSTDSSLIFKINTPIEGEYFLLENKDFSGWNSHVESMSYYINTSGVTNGLLALHVDESPNALGWENNCLNCYSTRNSMMIMSADGLFNGRETSTTWNYSNMSNMFYPGSSNITSLTDQTATNLLSWDNLPSNVAITEIESLSNKKIGFKINGGADYGVAVNTISADQITQTSASLSGTSSASVLGDPTIIERGFALNTKPYPRISDIRVAVSGQASSFDTTLTDLEPGIRYYCRSYGINANGTSYGKQISFITDSDPLVNNAIIDSSFAACETGETPTIIGTDPIGGSGTYSYRWLESQDGNNWIITQNSGINRDYTPAQMSGPRYYKRVVKSAEKTDTSDYTFVPIVPMTVAGEVSIENDSILVNGSTGEINLIGNVGDVVLWQRKDGNAQWAALDVGPVTNFSQVLDEKGLYQYRVRVRNGACPSKTSSPVSIFVSQIGLNDIDKDQIHFNIYPNPSRGDFTLDFNLESGNTVDMRIVNLLGKTVYLKSNLNSQINVNISTLESGVYFILLVDGERIIGRKQIQIIK